MNFYLYMTFVFFSNFCLMSSFLSTYLSDNGCTISKIATVFFIYQAAKMIFEVPTGYIADKYGKKTSGIIGCVLIILSYFVILFSKKNIVMAYISMVGKGIGYTCISGSVEALYVNGVNKDKLIKYNTIERFVFYISLALSVLVGGIVISMFSYQIAFVLDSIFMSIACISIVQMKEIGNREIEKKIILKSALVSFFENKLLMALYLIDFATAFSYVAVEDYYALFLSEKYELKHAVIGLIIATQLIVASAIGLIVPRINRIIENKRRMLYILLVLQVITTMNIYLVNSIIILVPIFYSMSSIMFAIYAPIKYEMFQKSIRDNIRAFSLSVQSIMIALGSICFSFMANFLGKHISLNNIIMGSLLITLLIRISAIMIIKMNEMKVYT